MNLPVSLKTLANVLGIVLLIAVVAPFVVYAVPGVIGADYSFVVLTASMTPAIAPGDVVVVADRDPATVVEGDVITFVRGDADVPVTHRVIGVVDTPDGVAFETQGVANGAPDAGIVPGANLVGVVALTIPYIGYVVQFADSPLGFAALVVVPFGLLLLSEAWTIYRSRTGGGAGNTGESTGTDSDEHGSDDGEAAGGAGGGVSATAIERDATGSGAATLALTPQTVTGAVVVLVTLVPYAAYVAYTLRTALSVSVAVATVASALFGIVLLVSVRGNADVDDSESADDSTEAESPSSADEQTGFETLIVEPTPDGGHQVETGADDDGSSPRSADETEAGQ